MTRNIYLNGEIGQLFGNKWRLNCKTIQEAMHAIDCMKGGMRRYLTDCTENGVGFTVQKGEDFLDNQTVGIELGKDDLIITPVPAGSRRQKSKGQSFVKIIVAVLMIYVGFKYGDPDQMEKGFQLLISVGTSLALQGITELLTKEPDELSEEQATLFNGPTNNTKSGIPVPLCYGKMEVGGAVVNFGFTQTRLRGSSGYQFVSKGTNNGTGTGGTTGGGKTGGGKGYNLQEAQK